MEFVSLVDPRPGDPVYDDMLALRRRVLRVPLGIDYTPAELELDAALIHLALVRQAPGQPGAVIGTLLLAPPDAEGTAKLKQMAIEPAFQRRGLGARLVEAGEAELGRRGASSIELAARIGAVPFYEKLRYVAAGEPYIAFNIPHIRMEKPLPKLPTSPKV